MLVFQVTIFQGLPHQNSIAFLVSIRANYKFHRQMHTTVLHKQMLGQQWFKGRDLHMYGMTEYLLTQHAESTHNFPSAY
jgi:hypothetical protein